MIGLAAACALAASAGGLARAQSTAWTPDDVAMRVVYLFQRGRGYQSQATRDPLERGSERLHVLETIFTTSFEQNERVGFRVTVPIDVVSSASVDAIDAVSGASKWNQSAGLETTADVRLSDDDTLSVSGAYAMEEVLWTVMVGAGYTRELADDNAALALQVSGRVDLRDPVGPDGVGVGLTDRETFSANASFTQVLSRTTLLALTYGLTRQSGRLETFWNSTPMWPPQGSRPRVAEKLPDARTRHAATVLLAQHLPATRTTLRAHYRFYADDFGLDAHSLTFTVYQYVTERLLLGAHYRFHRQTAVDFYRERAPPTWPQHLPLTSDSDLAAFDAHEWGLSARWSLHLPFEGKADHLELGALGYTRTNDLRVNGVSLTYGAVF